MNRNTGMNAGQIIGTMNGMQVVGLDIAKHVFQLHTVDMGTMGEASAFKSGREFCAWLGLVPMQTGSGGKVRLGNISKRGDTYLRTLLIHGARSVLSHAKDPGPWLAQIKERRPANVVIVAQAAKMARTIWAVTAKEKDYQRDFKSVRPLAA